MILAAVGGLENADLRVSKFDNGEHPVLEIEGPLEIVSIMGTLSTEGCHIHVQRQTEAGRLMEVI